MSGLQFRFSCLLTAMHYMVTTVGLELLRLGGVYESRASPLTPRLLLLVLLVGRYTAAPPHRRTAATPPPPPQPPPPPPPPHRRTAATAAPPHRSTRVMLCVQGC